MDWWEWGPEAFAEAKRRDAPIFLSVGYAACHWCRVTTRYRLNRYGDRNLNDALHTVVQSRVQYQPATRDYVARRTAEGKTSREIKRCLARYVARDLYRLLANGPAAA